MAAERSRHGDGAGLQEDTGSWQQCGAAEGCLRGARPQTWGIGGFDGFNLQKMRCYHQKWRLTINKNWDGPIKIVTSWLRDVEMAPLNVLEPWKILKTQQELASPSPEEGTARMTRKTWVFPRVPSVPLGLSWFPGAHLKGILMFFVFRMFFSFFPRIFPGFHGLRPLALGPSRGRSFEV